MANIVDSDFYHRFVIEDQDGNPTDVSTWTFELQLFRANERCPAYTLTDAITFSDDGTDGDCLITLTAAQTKQLGSGMIRFVIWRTDTGNRLVIGEGSAPFESLSFDA